MGFGLPVISLKFCWDVGWLIRRWWFCGVLLTTQVSGNYKKPLITRIPIKQPGESKSFFFSWLEWCREDAMIFFDLKWRFWRQAREFWGSLNLNTHSIFWVFDTVWLVCINQVESELWWSESLGMSWTTAGIHIFQKSTTASVVGTMESSSRFDTVAPVFDPTWHTRHVFFGAFLSFFLFFWFQAPKLQGQGSIVLLTFPRTFGSKKGDAFPGRWCTEKRGGFVQRAGLKGGRSSKAGCPTTKEGPLLCTIEPEFSFQKLSPLSWCFGILMVNKSIRFIYRIIE